jgi:hypothetical protein
MSMSVMMGTRLGSVFHIVGNSIIVAERWQGENWYHRTIFFEVAVHEILGMPVVSINGIG